MTLRAAYLFDSHALLNFFQAEAGHEKVLRLLEQIRKAGVRKYLNAINLGEIIYTTKREFGDQKKIEVLAHIERLDFTVLPVPNSLIFQAGGDAEEETLKEGEGKDAGREEKGGN